MDRREKARADWLAQVIAADAVAENEFGPITIGTPKQIVLARQARAINIAHQQFREKLAAIRSQADAWPEWQQAEEILPDLFCRAEFWNGSVSRELDRAVTLWLVRGPDGISPIRAILDIAGIRE